MGDDAREDTDELLNRLRALGAHEMLRIGELPPGASAGWPALTTDQIIVLAIRRAHYLARHPDMLVNERHVISTLRHPDQIRMDKDDPQTAIFYLRLERELWCVVPVWISDDPARLNSVKTAFVVDANEARRRQKKEQLVWGQGDR